MHPSLASYLYESSDLNIPPCIPAQDLVITSATISGGYIDGGSLAASPFRANAGPRADNVSTWIIATIDEQYVKMVEVKLIVTEQGIAYTWASAARLVGF